MNMHSLIPTLRKMKKMYWYYIIILPVLVYFIIFYYFPMYGALLAFKDFRFADGILGSPWVGLKHFNRVFSSPLFYSVLKNTVWISFLRTVLAFPAPVVFALLLNEIFHKAFKRTVQTISYLPYFMSWIVLRGILSELLSPSRGAVNYLLGLFGRDPVYFLGEPKYFVAVLIISGIWQSIGWGSVVYLAAITSVDAEQYESAYLDGANRWQQAVYITLPSILPVISIMFILNLGKILNAGFDQVFNLYNPAVYSVGDIIDTYVYRVGIENADYSYSTAVGLFKNIVGLILVLGSNMIIRKFGEGEYGVW